MTTTYVYAIVDRLTNQRIGGFYTNRIRATRRADALDLAYGAIRYTVVSEEQR
jgi:nucleoside-triphosphatase THEP1